MANIAVIGAGASGIIAALKASEKNHVILIDKNDKCGKKILVTGNGRCNYWNDNISLKCYHTDNDNYLEKILHFKEEVYNYLLDLGIYPHIKDGYYYPQSNSALSIREIFDNELKKRNIEFKYNFDVKDIQKIGDGFKIIGANEAIVCDKVIVSMGSKAMPKTGSDGFSYELAKKYNLKVNKVSPSLVGLYTNESFLKAWSGVRCDASVSLFIDNNYIQEEKGELQLTDNGISGICVFNISSNAIRSFENSQEVRININFAPFVNDFASFFEERALKHNNHNISELCESLFNYKLSHIFFKKSNINPNAYWKSLTINEKSNFIKTVTSFSLKMTGYGSFDKAQVCTGGISLNEINSETMECHKVFNMFLTGELLDVDGKCGGFNLAFAFISGYLAGKSV